MIWQILQPPDGYLFCFYPDIYPNSFGLAPASLFPAAKPLLRSVLDWTSQPNERWWSWRPALYLYLCIFCGVVAAIRRLDAKTILVFTPALANAAVMMVMNVAQDFRYQYPVYAIGLISPALLFCKRASDRPSAAA